jgi:hypothetical protein
VLLEVDEAMEGEERIFLMSLKLCRSSSSGKMWIKSEEESVRLEVCCSPEEEQPPAGSDTEESLRQLSDR